MITKKVQVIKPELGMEVYHEKIHDGKERMTIVGIRATEVELEGDWSGWISINGLFRLRKVCEQHQKFGTCTLPNVHCGYPDCEPYI